MKQKSRICHLGLYIEEVVHHYKAGGPVFKTSLDYVTIGERNWLVDWDSGDWHTVMPLDKNMRIVDDTATETDSRPVATRRV